TYHYTTISFFLLPPPPCSTLFPYTTLFRSVLLADHRCVGNQPAHVFPDIVDRLVAMIDEVLLPDRRDDPVANHVPFRGKPLAIALFDEITGGQDLSRYDEAAKNGFIALGLTRLDRHSDRHRGTLGLGVGESKRDVGSCLLALAL